VERSRRLYAGRLSCNEWAKTEDVSTWERPLFGEGGLGGELAHGAQTSRERTIWGISLRNAGKLPDRSRWVMGYSQGVKRQNQGKAATQSNMGVGTEEGLSLGDRFEEA